MLYLIINNLINNFKVIRLKSDNINCEFLAIKSIAPKIPRYVRVNTIKITFNEACHCLKLNGFIVEKLKMNISANDFVNKIEDLKKNMVYIDNHVENLLIFAPGTNLYEFCLKNDGFILQDKVILFPYIFYF